MCCGMFLASLRTLHVFSAHGTEREKLKMFYFPQRSGAALSDEFLGAVLLLP